MPRLRQENVSTAATVPAEFADIDNPVWASMRATNVWLNANGLVIHSAVAASLMRYGPATRRRFAIDAWLMASGFASERWPKLLDYHRMADLPLPSRYVTASHKEMLSTVDDS